MLVDDLKLFEENICNQIESMIESLSRSNLENCTGDVQDTPKEDNSMAYSRPLVLTGHDCNGKPLYKRVSGKTQDEINDSIVRTYVECGRIFDFLPATLSSPSLPISLTPLQITHDFCEYAWNEYYKFKEKSWGENTKVRERGAVKHLCEYFKGKAIEDISYRDVQGFMDDQAEKGLSISSIDSKRKTLGQIFEFALADGVSVINKSNPAQNPRLRNNGYESDGTIPLTFDEYKRVLDSISRIENAKTRLAVALLSLTGVRREELLGLKWTDFDFDKKFVYIQRAVIYPNGQPEEAPPKSKAGYRHIPIDDQLFEILNGLRENSGNVICNEHGEYLTEDETEKLLKSIREETGISRIDCHVFRTTFATMIAASGKMPPKNLQVIMGHSNIKVTMDVYAKAEKTLIGMNRNVLTEMFSGIRG